MNILLKYLCNNVSERKTQSAVMLLSILLSTTLLFVSLSMSSSYGCAQRKMARGMAGGATLSVTATEGTITANAVPELSSIGNSVGLLEGTALYHENGYYETIDLIAADLAQLNQVNPPRLTEGGNLTKFTGNQVVLPDRFTAKYGIERGDDITLQFNGTPIRLKVAAIAAYDTVFLRHTRGATALLPLSTLAELLGQPEGYHQILLEPSQGASTASLKHELTAALSDGYQVSEIMDEAQISADVRQKSMPFYLISFFCLTMSVFIIYSSYKVITLDRLPVIGAFRSIGATQKTVTRILILESGLYGVIGGLIGIPVGVLALKLILQGLGRSLALGIEIPMVISPFHVGLALLVAVMVSVISAWLPARRASRLATKDLVLGHVDDNKVPRRWIVGGGAALLLFSILLPRAVPENLLYLAGGFSLLGLIAATIPGIPLLINTLSRVLERFYGRILGNEGKLAARNMRDNQNTAQNITLLLISISAIIAITVVSDFVTAYVSDVFRDAELDGFADGYMEQDFIEQVKDMEGVEQVLPLHVFENQIQADGVLIPRLEATDSLERYSSMLALHYTDHKMFAQALSAFAADRAILLSENCLDRMGVAIGDPLLLSKQAGQETYVVVGSFQSRATDVDAVISSTYAVLDFGASNYDFLAYTAAEPEAIMVQIRSLFGGTSNWSRTVEEFNLDAHATVDAFLHPMRSMTYFILLLATVGVVNNLLINYMQKRRVMAMYQSVGLSHRQQRKITLIEGISCGLIGGAIAIFVSYLEIQTIFLVAGPNIAMTPEWNAATFLTAAATGIVVTTLGSIVPIWKFRNRKLVEELKFD